MNKGKLGPTSSSSPTYTEGGKLEKIPSKSVVEGESKMLELVTSLNGERTRCSSVNYMETRVREYHKRKVLDTHTPKLPSEGSALIICCQEGLVGVCDKKPAKLDRSVKSSR